MGLLESEPLLNNETLLVVDQQPRHLFDALAGSAADPLLGLEVNIKRVIEVLICESSQEFCRRY
jgi:hypothetical protein